MKKFMKNISSTDVRIRRSFNINMKKLKCLKNIRARIDTMGMRSTFGGKRIANNCHFRLILQESTQKQYFLKC